jgi:hypothetical protein
MAEYLIQDSTLTAIADAVRSKTGDTGLIPVGEMAAKIGALAVGGGANGTWVFNTGSFVASADSHTIDHGLGIVPDVVAVWATSIISATTGLVHTMSFSAAAIEAMGNAYACNSCSPNAYVTSNKGIETSIISKYGYARDATATQFTVGGSTIKLQSSVEYTWIAIGGIFG